MSRWMSGNAQLGIRQCVRCRTMKKISGKKIICARCEQELEGGRG